MRPLLLLLASIALVASAGCDDGSAGSGDASATSAAGSFVDRYVSTDGRVLRRDQGGDTVSEGQAYGMLLAEVAGREDVVRRIWGWTKQHMQRDDGLLGWHADSSGKVVDWSAASDADTLAAFALLRYGGPGSDALHADGRVMARAVLDHEAVTTQAGLVPAAGDWATGAAPVVDPSYWMPWVARSIASMTGDDRWSQAAGAMETLLAGPGLPPDWASVRGGTLTPAGAGGGSGTPQYGPDAQRLPIFLAAGGDAERRLAASWWDSLRNDPAAGVRSVDGAVVDRGATPTSAMAAAAAARAAGDTSAADRLTDQAVTSAKDGPTYYGDACVALGLALAQGKLK